MFNYMLNPDQIIKIRNDELMNKPELLELCVSEKTGITDSSIKNAF
jgi:hypothetical protein